MSANENQSSRDLLADFVDAFCRGIADEVKAMRARRGADEIELEDGKELEHDDARGRAFYSFRFRGSAGRIGVGDECSLRSQEREVSATIGRIEDGRIDVVAKRRIDLAAEPIRLLSAPWFLYQRLTEALSAIKPESHALDRALELFGKGATKQNERTRVDLRLPHLELNDSQRAAVQLASDSSLAFIWGPPGTGKTTTLAHLVDEMVSQGKRVLLASTTNAALDQALEKVAQMPGLEPLITSGLIIRMGHDGGESFGTALDEVCERLHKKEAEDLARRAQALVVAEAMARHGRALEDELSAAAHPQQSLFAEPAVHVSAALLAGLLPGKLAEKAARTSQTSLAAVVTRRVARFTRLAKLLRARVLAHRHALREGQREAVERANVVFATLANTYLSPLLEDVRFDVLIVDEASMATLPTLFYAASLAASKTVIVGDPRQLPPITQSDSRLAARVLGRDIFSVTVPSPATSEIVALLDTQYRMAPTIGNLVGELFYDGLLKNGAVTATRRDIAESPPYPARELVVVDTSGQTLCSRAKVGSSRTNELAAELCAQLASEADANERTTAVITPYAAQARTIREHLAKRRCSARVECSTIHRFQGQERDVVIIDLVDTLPMRPSRLLADRDGSPVARLLNVSMSRALGKLVIVADIAYFEKELAGSVATAALHAAIRTGARVRFAPPSS